MSDATAIVDGLSETNVIRMVKLIESEVMNALSDEELKRASRPYAGLVDPLIALDEDTREIALDSEQSVEASRQILRALAAAPDLAPLVVQAWDEMKKDKSLFIVETIVAVGLVANLTIFMATTTFKFKAGNVIVEKRPADPKLVSAVLKPLADLVKALVKKTPLPR